MNECFLPVFIRVYSRPFAVQGVESVLRSQRRTANGR